MLIVQVPAEFRHWRSSGTPSGTADQSLWRPKKGSIYSECELWARPYDRKGNSRCSIRCRLMSSKNAVTRLNVMEGHIRQVDRPFPACRIPNRFGNPKQHER